MYTKNIFFLFFSTQGALCRTLQGHGHWVNTLALNTDYALRTGAYHPKNLMKVSPEYTKGKKKKKKKNVRTASKKKKKNVRTASKKKKKKVLQLATTVSCA